MNPQNILPEQPAHDRQAKKLFVIFLIMLGIFAGISVFGRQHIVDGDAIGYIDAMHVIKGAPLDASLVGQVIFAKQALLTTFFGLEIIIFLSFFFGKLTTAWLVFDAILYFLANAVFYKLLLKIFKSPKTAFIGGLFFAANYSMVIFGLTYFMDVGGWFFYCLSLYFLYAYVDSGMARDLYTSALAIAVGALFKESVPFAFIAMACVLAYENFRSPSGFVKKMLLPFAIAFAPMIIHHIDIFLTYDYSYLQFVELNRKVYHYKSLVAEYIKNFGALLNWLIPLSLGGCAIILKSLWSEEARAELFREFGINAKKLLFVAAVLISSIPVIIWPGITERVLFMVVPGLVILACFFVKRYERFWYLFLCLVTVYAVCSFLMDSVILKAVNLPF